MKQPLSLLVAYAFLQAQIWAIGGGPQSSSASASSLVGNYAGALLPSSSSANVLQTNGLGLFTLSLPQTGLGKGQFIYFSEGKTFTGSITGLGDPKKQQFVGLVKAQFDIVVDSITITDATFGNASLNQTVPGGFANGTIKAKFRPGGSAIISTAGRAIAGLRMTGQAKLEISELTQKTVTNNNGTPTDTTDDTTSTTSTVTSTSALTLVVDGFQQSATSSTSTTATGG